MKWLNQQDHAGGDHAVFTGVMGTLDTSMPDSHQAVTHNHNAVLPLSVAHRLF